MPYVRNEDPFVKAYLQNGNKPFIISGISIDVTESGEARQHVFMRTLTSTLPTVSEVSQDIVGKGHYFPLENKTYDIIGNGVLTDKEIIDEINLGIVILPFDAQADIDSLEYSREYILASSNEGQYLIKEALKTGKILRITINEFLKVTRIKIVK
jgi:hypothetical protein